MVSLSKVKLEPSWLQQLSQEFEQSYMQALKQFLLNEKSMGVTVYPAPKQFFNAFELTPFEQVKVVILGQDPYHGPGQAHGLSFSVPHRVSPPPSLKNIYRELADDVGFHIPQHGCLESWAQQGVLLLNSVLSVRQGQAGAHQGQGWERFTDQVIERLNSQRDGLVFMLWGAYAQKKGAFIDKNRHLVLSAPHPSPLSAHRGFLGCRHFSQANHFLESQGVTPIHWQL